MNNQFFDNQAIYGPSIGSFPFTLKLMNLTKTNLLTINSGEVLQETIFVGIYDQQEQLVNNDNTSEGTIFT